MKKSIAVFLVVLFGASACSQYTCPTYASNDAEEVETVQVVEGEQKI